MSVYKKRKDRLIISSDEKSTHNHEYRLTAVDRMKCDEQVYSADV